MTPTASIFGMIRPFVAEGAARDLPPPFRFLRGHERVITGGPEQSGDDTFDVNDRATLGGATTVVRTAHDGTWALSTASIPRARGLDDVCFRSAGASAIERAVAALRAAVPHPVVRMWSFIPGINDESSDGDRYRTFNIGRADAFAMRAGALEPLPAASGVGHAGEAIVVHAFALRGDARHIENPRQIPAWRYSRRFGQRPPLFSRATVVRDGASTAFFASGTASVVGETSAHAGDFDAQLEETHRNLAALCGETALSPREALRFVRVHVRPSDAARMGDALDAVRLRLPDATIEPVLAPLCRPELAIEIEGCAWSPPT